MKKLFFLFAFFQVQFLSAQAPYYHAATHYREPNSEAREHQVDIQRMSLEVRFQPKAGKVLGTVTHVFSSIRDIVDSIVFDAVKINVKELTLNGKKVGYVRSDSTIVVFPENMHYGSTDSISIVYEATPKKGIYFIGWNVEDKPKISGVMNIRKQIWTQGQAVDNRHWIPMYDATNDKYITETIIYFDKEYSVLSNGIKIGEKELNDGSKRWHYAMTQPHAGYLLMLGIGKYSIETRISKSGVKNYLWYYPEFPDHVRPMYKYSIEAMDFLEEHIGVPYPWEHYSQIPVQDFIFGAMENTTATVFGDFYHADERAALDRNYIGTNVHELTHQWFGDFITQRNPKSIWLHESFATFYPKLFFRKFENEDSYQWNRRDEQLAAIAASEKDRLPIVHTGAGSSRIYPKGSAVLDLLMHTVGEKPFQRTIQRYLKQHAYANVETNDFYQAFQDELGLTLDWFFDEWLYRGGEPHYNVSWKQRDEKSTVEITVRQIHVSDNFTGLFSTPVDLEIYYSDGSMSKQREKFSRSEQTIEIAQSIGKKVVCVVFDAGSWIPKKLTFKKTLQELEFQSKNAVNMIDRYDAVAALKDDSSNISKKINILGEVFQREKFHAIRSEILRQYGEMKEQSEVVQKIIKLGLSSPDLHVRKSALSSIKDKNAALYKKEIALLLADSSYSLTTAAANKLCYLFPNEREKWLGAIKGIIGMFAEVRIAYLEQQVLGGNIVFASELSELASSAYEFRTRINAYNALKRLNYCDKSVVEDIFDGMLNPNSRLASAALSTGEYFFQQSAKAAEFRQLYNAGTWTDNERGVLKKLVK